VYAFDMVSGFFQIWYSAKKNYQHILSSLVLPLSRILGYQLS
jgi:hypothetical protein